jgi:signal transduction histidine kinase
VETHRVVDELHPQAEDAGVALQREHYGSHFAYLGDEERLYQLVVNLGSNAIRFTPRGGRVVVRVIDASPETARLESLSQILGADPV